jgi:hypothetical protein
MRTEYCTYHLPRRRKLKPGEHLVHGEWMCSKCFRGFPFHRRELVGDPRGDRRGCGFSRLRFQRERAAAEAAPADFSDRRAELELIEALSPRNNQPCEFAKPSI